MPAIREARDYGPVDPAALASMDEALLEAAVAALERASAEAIKAANVAAGNAFKGEDQRRQQCLHQQAECEADRAGHCHPGQSPAKTGLASEVDALVDRSPTLKDAVFEMNSDKIW